MIMTLAQLVVILVITWLAILSEHDPSIFIYGVLVGVQLYVLAERVLRKD